VQRLYGNNTPFYTVDLSICRFCYLWRLLETISKGYQGTIYLHNYLINRLFPANKACLWVSLFTFHFTWWQWRSMEAPSISPCTSSLLCQTKFTCYLSCRLCFIFLSEIYRPSPCLSPPLFDLYYSWESLCCTAQFQITMPVQLR
jgi:hypothetical protein